MRKETFMKQETIDQVIKFRDERNWKQFHTPKDLAISISLEAAELLEVFQWSRDDVWCEEKMENMREELADVLIYGIMMADTCGMDLDEIIQEKIRKNAENIRWKRQEIIRKSIRSCEGKKFRFSCSLLRFLKCQFIK